jgi:hypothetical protein
MSRCQLVASALELSQPDRLLVLRKVGPVAREVAVLHDDRTPGALIAMVVVTFGGLPLLLGLLAQKERTLPRSGARNRPWSILLSRRWLWSGRSSSS